MWRRVDDDAQRQVVLPHPPRRIVSLVPSVTELVCDLGAADRLIAVTRYCTQPPAVVARLARVGGTKTPLCERIVDLRPDLVLINSEENRRVDFEALLARDVPVFVSFATSVAAAAHSVSRLGQALGVGAPAVRLAREIERTASEVRRVARRRCRVFCPIWRKPWMSFNADTYCHDVLASAGGDNLCADAVRRYPEVDLECIAAAAPEIILLPDEPYPFARRHLRFLQPLTETPAWRAGRVMFVDGKALSWYGARTPAALRQFAKLFARLGDQGACEPARA